MKHARLTYTLLLLPILLIGFFFMFGYNYHLIFKEQLQLFQFTTSYFQSFLDTPGGFGSWLGAFFTQFYHINHLGGFIIGCVLTLLLGMLLLFLKRWKMMRYVWFALIPVVVAALFLMDINANIGGVLSIVLAISLTFIIQLIPITWIRILLSVLLLPVVYWGLGGAVLFFVLFLLLDSAFTREFNGLFAVILLLLTIAMPFVTRLYIRPTTLKQVLVGDAFYRGNARPTLSGIQINMREEAVYKMDHLLKQGKWKEMVAFAEKKKYTNALFVSYTNIALLHEKQLGQKLFYFAQRPDINEFWTSEYLAMYLTGELYYQLDMQNAARAYLFMAHTQTPEGVSPFMLRRLAEVEIIRQCPDVALKHIGMLKQTLFYRSLAKEMEESIRTGVYPQELQVHIQRYNPPGDFLAKEMVYNLRKTFDQQAGNALLREFLPAKYLLMKDFQRFISCFPELKVGFAASWPKSFQEALLMYAFMTNDDQLVRQSGINQQIISDFFQYTQINQSGASPDEIRKSLETKYGDTYWFYVQYK